MMIIGKQINKGYKCPNCKSYGLKPMHEKMVYNNSSIHDGFCFNYTAVINYFKCQKCYAEYEAKELKK